MSQNTSTFSKTNHVSPPYCFQCGQLKKWAFATGQYEMPATPDSYPAGIPEIYCASCGTLRPYQSLKPIGTTNNVMPAHSTQRSSSHAQQKSSGGIHKQQPALKYFDTYQVYDEVVKAAYRPTSQLVVGKGIPQR
jgi:hypothetical protein